MHRIVALSVPNRCEVASTAPRAAPALPDWSTASMPWCSRETTRLARSRRSLRWTLDASGDASESLGMRVHYEILPSPL